MTRCGSCVSLWLLLTAILAVRGAQVVGDGVLEGSVLKGAWNIQFQICTL
jgi:hypothetical protein